MDGAILPVVSLRAVSKRFDIYDKPTDLLIEALSGRKRRREFMAVTDVSFDLQHGSILGILGRNGAGKSTLLKLVAGTLTPTTGDVLVRGKVAAILELGSGFHPDRTGRENVFMGGLCLGMTREEITRRFDEIVDFAELWEFIDQPFRTYSSGMQARLTFAVATSVDPDVLIIDEALAVGDARFTLKSFDRVRDFARRGKSILLVSHDINQVVSFCDHAILLERGAMIATGNPNTVGNVYHELLFGTKSEARAAPAAAGLRHSPDPSPAPASAERHESPLLTLPVGGSREHRYGDGLARIVDLYIQDARGVKVTRLNSLVQYEVVAVVKADADVADLSFGFIVRTARGIEVFGADCLLSLPGDVLRLRRGEIAHAIGAFRSNLAPGLYFMTAAIGRRDGRQHDLRFDALEFVVNPADGVYTASIVNLEMKFAFAPPHHQQKATSER